MATAADTNYRLAIRVLVGLTRALGDRGQEKKLLVDRDTERTRYLVGMAYLAGDLIAPEGYGMETLLICHRAILIDERVSLVSVHN